MGERQQAVATQMAQSWGQCWGRAGFDVGLFAGITIGTPFGGLIGGVSGYLDSACTSRDGVSVQIEDYKHVPHEEDRVVPYYTKSLTSPHAEDRVVAYAQRAGGAPKMQVLAHACERGGLCAMRGGEFGGSFTGVLIALPFAAVGGVLGGVVGFAFDVKNCIVGVSEDCRHYFIKDKPEEPQAKIVPEANTPQSDLQYPAEKVCSIDTPPLSDERENADHQHTKPIFQGPRPPQ